MLEKTHAHTSVDPVAFDSPFPRSERARRTFVELDAQVGLDEALDVKVDLVKVRLDPVSRLGWEKRRRHDRRRRREREEWTIEEGPQREGEYERRSEDRRTSRQRATKEVVVVGKKTGQGLNER